MKNMISVVSPIYRGEKMLQELVDRNTAVLEDLQNRGEIEDYEIILVNDASPDNSWLEVLNACQRNKHVKGINLSRNFGQHYAITAGLQHAEGNWVVIMDCDLQDQPEDITRLYEETKKGFDFVQARRAVKHVGWWKKMSSVWFHNTLDWLSGMKTDPAIGNYGIYKRPVVDAMNAIPQQARGLHTMLNIVGFKSSSIDVEQVPSARGGSSYTLSKLLNQAMNVILARTNKPLRMAVTIGFAMSGISFLLALYNILAKLFGIIRLTGYTTTVFSIWFVGGIMLLMMGILGLYIGKIFDQVKGHPLYVVKDKVNFNTHQPPQNYEYN